MRKITVLGLIVCCFALSVAEVHARRSIETYTTLSFFQEFISHKVKKGETVYSISKDYGILEKEIYQLNPDVKNRIYEGLVLILPSSAKSNTVSTHKEKDLDFKIHKVKRKETLYSISRIYNASEDIIKKYNKQLYTSVLKKGDKLKIPVNYKKQKVSVATVDVVKSSLEETNQASSTVTTNSVIPITYTVKSKETKYGIAKKYGITVAQLEKMNPDIGSGLREGAEIQIPTVITTSEIIVDESKYSFYEVKKGNTMYSLLREFNLKEEHLISLNPALKDGLKLGMILKIPKRIEGDITPDLSPIAVNGNTKKINLADSITDYSIKNIAVMLPFGLNRATVDTVDVRKNMLKSDRVLRLALDFHSGILMAVNDAEKMGISTNVVVYDTGYDRNVGKATNARKVENIINENDFSNTDAVIGPMLGFNVDRVANLLESDSIPIVSPLTQRISGGSNLFQTRPSDDLLRTKMLVYLKTLGEDKNVVIIADSKNSETKSKLKSLFPKAQEVTPREGDNGMFLYADDIPSKISADKPNLVVVETDDVPLISNVTTSLNALATGTVEEGVLIKRDITLFTTYRGRAYDSDEVQHTHLMNLNFHFPSIEKEYDNEAVTFINAYKAKYNITPSTEAIRGYDIMMDTLLRLGYAQDLFQSVSFGLETKYIENKFLYTKSEKGFYNTGTYIMRYDQDLLLKEVITPSPIEE